MIRVRLLMGGKVVRYDKTPTAIATIGGRRYQNQYFDRIAISMIQIELAAEKKPLAWLEWLGGFTVFNSTIYP
jgi:hypothetical protein